MPRGVRKPIEQRINEKKEIINALEIRIGKETEEFKALLKEQKDKSIEMLAEFIINANISPEEATEILKEQISK